MLRRLIPLQHRTGDASAPASGPARQAGVVPYRIDADDVVRFMLITSRRTGRWIFPKGGRGAAEPGPLCAAREAWEEAGLEGQVAGPSLGAYRTVKSRQGRPAETVQVDMYLFAVTAEHAEWPESAQRRRRWATLDEVRALIRQPDLLALAERAHARLSPVRPAAMRKAR